MATTKKTVGKTTKTNTTNITKKSVKKLGVSKPLTETQKLQLKTRKEFYADNDVLQFNSSVRKAKNSDLPFLNKKQLWCYNYLLKNDIKKNYRYSIEQLSNEYRKLIKDNSEKIAKKSDYKFRKSFKSGELITSNDLKSVCQYIYIVNHRYFEYYRNENKNYFLIEKQYKENLTHLKQFYN